MTKGGEQFYDTTALHKSVRRPPDAALYWFMRHARRGAEPKYMARRFDPHGVWRHWLRFVHRGAGARR
jgi:replication-associated recombination protein RarA